MKDFLKMAGASFTAMVIYGALCFFILILCISGFVGMFDFNEVPNEIKKYIYTNIQNNINGKVVAKAFNYNYDYFRKMFK